MVELAFIVLLAWPLVVITLFALLRPARAVVVAFVAGWLFLPLISLDVTGLPPYGKFTATSMAVIVCIALFDWQRLMGFRFSWLDLPMLVWCLVPMASSLSNGLGAWDGVSGISDRVLTYAIPYLVGRLYLTKEERWAYLGKALVMGAIVYLPLCIWEMRMSPQLHGWVYGIRGRAHWEYGDAFGMFGWQPTVFMNSVFEVNMLMSMAALTTFWAWRSGRLRKIQGVDIRWFVPCFVVMAVLCKKWSNIGLMLIGLTALALTEKIRSPIWVYAIIFLPIGYMTLFSLDIYRGEGISDQIGSLSERRAESFQFRLDNDAQLVDKAMQRPIFGWGGWGRNRVHNEQGKDVSVTDSAYGIFLGVNGIVGLAAITLVYTLPFLTFVRKWPPKTWLRAPASMVVPFAMIVGLHLIDNLFNAFPNAMYPMFAGGVTAFVLSSRSAAPQSRRRSRTRGRIRNASSGIH